MQIKEVKSGKVLGSAKKSHLYRTDQRLKNRPLGDLVSELGECVVMIRTPIGLGSGFLIHQDGYVITNDHVVAGERQVSITQFTQKNGELIKENYDNVRIVATGGNVDLALLKIEGHTNKVFPTVALGSSTELRQGERVFAIGSPLGWKEAYPRVSSVCATVSFRTACTFKPPPRSARAIREGPCSIIGGKWLE